MNIMDSHTNKPIGYGSLSDRKSTGSHYTPTKLSDFVATQLINSYDFDNNNVRIIDPAIGDGELLESLVNVLTERKSSLKIYAFGFDIDNNAIDTAQKRLTNLNANIPLKLSLDDFLNYSLSSETTLFGQSNIEKYDLVIANPPYVRTQVLGASKSQILAKQFGLTGRVDLYHAFILGIANILSPGGLAGIIVSNRFMTTKAGEMVRKNILDYFDILHIWDFGDTHLFEAAVLPAVLLLKKKSSKQNSDGVSSKFTSIYSIKENDTNNVNVVDNIFGSLDKDGMIKEKNSIYKIQTGILDHGKTSTDVWRMSNNEVDDWLNTVKKNTFCVFSDIGKIKVGVKTTADKVFIRSDWETATDNEVPELLKPLLTHHKAKRFKANHDMFRILYPHIVKNGVRTAVELDDFPKSAKYLNKHKEALQNRKYVIEAGRKWYEIWVSHNPDLWKRPKIVFRDISEKPTFWLDLSGAIVNGDCYWFTSNNGDDERLWLALGVSNSTFIETFYDRKFNNKLYSGRRRFITQYVEKFPLPNPDSSTSKKIVEVTKTIYNLLPDGNTELLEKELDTLVYQSFGFK